LGADFAGETILSSIVLADVKLAHGPSDSRPVASQEIAGILTRAMDADLGLLEGASPDSIATKRQVAQYRHGMA
jgi:hypothetical protein